jgi:hypothetical protein
LFRLLSRLERCIPASVPDAPDSSDPFGANAVSGLGAARTFSIEGGKVLPNRPRCVMRAARISASLSIRHSL